MSNAMNETWGGKGDFIVVLGEAANSPVLASRLSNPELWRRGSANYACRRLWSGLNVLALGSGSVVSTADESGGIIAQLDLPALDGQRSSIPQTVIADWRRGNQPDALAMQGSFAMVGWNPQRGFGCTDLFHSCQLYYRDLSGGAIAFGTDLRLLAACSDERPRLSLQSVYHFLNLYYVPTPSTMYEGICKAPPASYVWAEDGRVTLQRYWWPAYPESIGVSQATAAAEELLAVMERAVLRQRPKSGTWGTFLSGGTDSSSISGILARAVRPSDAPVRSFSIGFEEDGYDELAYCDIAAKYYGLDGHRGYVSAAATLEMLPDIVSAYDEPVGNASSIPTMACVRLAREAGVELLIGGDGGDEIFGGNERYKKDAIMQQFYCLPAFVKRMLGSLISVIPGEARFTNRIRNFVHRSSLPNPDRFYTDDAFASVWFESLLTEQMRDAVRRDASLDVLRDVYRRADAPSELHKLMFLDLELTIADNDVVKVTRAARANKVAVRFPYLDRELVEFTGKLAASLKLQKGEKRYLFRRAVRNLLPPEVLRKKKQGFGLPVSVWLKKDARYVELLNDVLGSSTARLRSLVRPQGVRRLLERHQSGAWDHGAELWALLMLEQWFVREDVRP